MEQDLTRFHAWHLIRAILLRVSFQYHDAGISSGRSHAAYVYDAWAHTFPYTGPQLIEPPIEKLVAELLRRDPLIANRQRTFHFGLRTLSSAEITLVTVHCLAKCHEYLATFGYTFIDAITATKGVVDFFGQPGFDLARFIPAKLIHGQTSITPSDVPELKALVEELEHRRDLIIIDPYVGIQATQQ